MTLKAVYRVGDQFGEQFCEAIEEDDNGLHLFDGSGEQIGYVPYDRLNHVVPAAIDE